MILTVEILLKTYNIQLGAKIIVYADYINNTNSTTKHTSKHMQYQCSLIEEFRPKFVYLKELANNLADLCHLEGEDTTFKKLNHIK